MDGHDKSAEGSADNLDKSNTQGAAGGASTDTGASAGAGAGIFSTPDLTVNTENLPQNQPVKPASAPRFNFGRRANRGNASAESSERVASAFAQTDASQQAERLSDAMLESANAATQSTATGDIQLDVPKKEKKWPLVLAALVVLIGVVGGVAWFTWSSLDRVEIKQEVPVAEPFYKYANFLISGEASEMTVSESALSQANDTILISMVYSGDLDKKAAYFDQAQELMIAFVNAAINNRDVDSSARNTTLATLAEASKSQFNTLKEYSSVEQLNYPNMINQYLQVGAETVIPFVRGAYDEMAQSSDDLLASIASQKIQLAQTMVTVFNAYAAGGCINADGIVDACVDQLVLTDEVRENQALLTELVAELSASANQPITNVLNGCRNILGVLNGTLDVSKEEE